MFHRNLSTPGTALSRINLFDAEKRHVSRLSGDLVVREQLLIGSWWLYQHCKYNRLVSYGCGDGSIRVASIRLELIPKYKNSLFKNRKFPLELY